MGYLKSEYIIPPDPIKPLGKDFRWSITETKINRPDNTSQLLLSLVSYQSSLQTIHQSSLGRIPDGGGKNFVS